MTLVESALACHDRGWVPIPLNEHKAPVGERWTETRWNTYTAIEEEFATATNLGVLLGTPSGNLVDVDIDSPTARRIANQLDLLPPTPVESGHAGGPRSHRWYVVPDPPPTQALRGVREDGRADTIVEIRSTGAQTMIPPSTHSEHGRVTWTSNGLTVDMADLPEPATVESVRILVNVHLLALLTVLVDHWPGEGARHDAHLRLAGGLLITARDGEPNRFWTDRAEGLLRVLADLTHDREARNREAGVESTIDAIQRGRRVQGWPSLAELIGEGAVERARDFANTIARLHGYTPPRASESPSAEPLPRTDASTPGTPADSSTGTQAPSSGTWADEYPDAPEALVRMLEATAVNDPLDGVASLQRLDADLSNLPVPTIGHRTDGEPLLVPGTMSLLFGGNKSGKTWTAYAMIADVLARSGTALLIDYEVGSIEVQHRFTAMGVHPTALATRLDYLRLRRPFGSIAPPGRRGKPDIVDTWLARTLMDRQYDLIVIDAAYGFLGLHGLDTTVNPQWQQAEPMLTEVMTATGAAVVVVDHTGRDKLASAAIGASRKGGSVTHMTASVQAEPERPIEVGALGWSHVLLREERLGLLGPITSGDGDARQLATIVVDARNHDRQTRRGPVHVSLEPPRPMESAEVPDGPMTQAALAAETPKRTATGAEVLVLAEALIADHPEGISTHGLEGPLREAVDEAGARLTQQMARSMLGAWQRDGTLSSIPNPAGRGRLFIP